LLILFVAALPWFSAGKQSGSRQLFFPPEGIAMPAGIVIIHTGKS